MKTPQIIFITAFLSMLPLDSYAFPEIPFCPAGGPPGWLNHFNHKRDQNIWRLQHRQYQNSSIPRHASSYYRPSYQPGFSPDYRGVNVPNYYRILPYTPAYRYQYERP